MALPPWGSGRDPLALQETADILRTTGLGTGTGQPFPTEWLGADDGASGYG